MCARACDTSPHRKLMRCERREAREGEVGKDRARVCVRVCACMHPSAHVFMARRGRRGANDNLSHKERKRKRAQRKRGGGKRAET